MTLSSHGRKSRMPIMHEGLQPLPHVCQQGQPSQSPPVPSSALVVQGHRESSRLDPEQKSPSAQGRANKAPSHGATQGEEAEGLLEQLLPRRA